MNKKMNVDRRDLADVKSGPRVQKVLLLKGTKCQPALT